MPNIFDESGIITQGIDEYRKDMSERAKVLFADKTEGGELKTDDSSVIGRLLSIFSKPLAQNAEILPVILQSFDINSAEGQQLDNLLWNVHRIKRKDMSSATGMVILHGDINSLVAKGSQVANEVTGDSYKIDRDVTFLAENANGVDIQIDNPSSSFSLSYTIEGQLSSSPKIVVESDPKLNTAKLVADRLVDAINGQSSYLRASRNNDNSVRVNIKDYSSVGDFSVSGELSIVRSYMPVYITSTTYDSRESLAGQVKNIRTATLGWRSVFNPFYIFPSTGIESDEDYRNRGRLKQQGNTSNYTAILMALKSVRGVVYENVQQNTSKNPTNTGIVNNGVAITVMGGNEDDIALAIFDSVGAGIYTSGDIVKIVNDINGFGHEVRFSRPVSVPLEIKMSLITYPDFPTNGNARIKQAIVEWFNELNVGDDIHYSRLYEPINNIKGFAVKSLRFGYKGGTLDTGDVIIRHNEIATISAEDIKIGGS